MRSLYWPNPKSEQFCSLFGVYNWTNLIVGHAKHDMEDNLGVKSGNGMVMGAAYGLILGPLFGSSAWPN